MSSTSLPSVGLELADARGADSGAWRAVHFLERILAAALLGLSSPVLVVAAVVITVLSKRAPFVAHRRVAQEGRPLWVLKLRTMWNQEGKPGRFHKAGLIERLPLTNSGECVQKRARDPRIRSAFAVFCRIYSLDELPQFWHVIRGEMALVGPRPLTQYELDQYYGPDAAKVLSRRPGLTGLWQIRGRSRLGYRQRRRLDLFLVKNWSLKLYLTILVTTVPKVLLGKDAW